MTDPIRATAPVRAFQEGIIGQVPRVSMGFPTQILTRALSVPGQGIFVSSHPPVDHDWFPRLTPNEGEYGHIIKQNNNTHMRIIPTRESRTHARESRTHTRESRIYTHVRVTYTHM